MFSFFKKKKDSTNDISNIKQELDLNGGLAEISDENKEQNEAQNIDIKPDEFIQKVEVANEEEKKNFFSRALEKTFLGIKNIVPQKKEKISFEDIEELLIEADVEYEIIEKAMNGLPSMITRKELRHRLVMLFEHAPKVNLENHKPFVRLIIGVNGAGKTTTIAKLANKIKKDGQSVILGAGDTFRAAAIEQLSTWAAKLDVPIIKTKQGHDPSAVAFDTISSAIAKNIDNVLIDTAGRLQTQTNLNNELKKIVKVCDKAMSNSPHQKLLILDGTQGNSAIAQARAFHEMVNIDGIIVTKLDGTAKGGALFSISNQLELPIFYVGIGEKQDDLIEFSPDSFVDSLLDEIYISI
jgi:fused signal recognition particle receptor